MAFFLEMSMSITRILHKYVPAEAIHVYSVDESYVDLSDTEKLWGNPNMLMAKLVLDQDYSNGKEECRWLYIGFD